MHIQINDYWPKNEILSTGITKSDKKLKIKEIVSKITYEMFAGKTIRCETLKFNHHFFTDLPSYRQ